MLCERHLLVSALNKHICNELMTSPFNSYHPIQIVICRVFVTWPYTLIQHETNYIPCMHTHTHTHTHVYINILLDGYINIYDTNKHTVHREF